MIESGLFVLIIAIVFGTFLILKSIKKFTVNAFLGLMTLLLVNTLGNVGIGYSWLAVLICGIGGILGAFLVILLHFLGFGI